MSDDDDGGGDAMKDVDVEILPFQSYELISLRRIRFALYHQEIIVIRLSQIKYILHLKASGI